MLEFTTDQFNWHSDTKTFVAESSELDLPARLWNSLRTTPVETTIELRNPKTQNSQIFFFKFVDKSPENEVYGWNYKSEEGTNLLIIND